MAEQGWYPADLERCARRCRAISGRWRTYPSGGRLVGLLAPHAGYVYSGRVAAAAFRQLRGRERDYDVVALLGTSHHEPDGGMVYTGDFFATPLGRVPVEKDLVRRLCQRGDLYTDNERAHVHDHSLEMQLPFLQSVLSAFSIVPILVGRAGREALGRMGRYLGRVLAGRRALIVVSSDLSHYPAAEEARRIDTAALEAVRLMNAEEMLARLEALEREPVRNLHCVLCGKNALAAGMAAAAELGARRAEVIMYRNSGDVSGDKSRCVGYGAVGFYAEPRGAGEELSESEKAALLSAARQSLAAAVEGGEYTPPPPPEGSRLARRQGAFVTLKRQGELRGCIGRFDPEESLLSTVVEMARAAALEDPRFPPLGRDELADLSIDISVLSPLRRVGRPEEVEVGRHGVCISLRGRRGTLLPQVAPEHGWDRDTLLSQVCRKAGLPADAWRDPEAILCVYTAEVFGGAYA
ncbi:AmmeMemoRadiSam system protein B [bacterium]|nr:AmmeMemoRadiSam system protein B [bacterium]